MWSTSGSLEETQHERAGSLKIDWLWMFPVGHDRESGYDQIMLTTTDHQYYINTFDN